jgi:hypothetical protein
MTASRAPKWSVLPVEPISHTANVNNRVRIVDDTAPSVEAEEQPHGRTQTHNNRLGSLAAEASKQPVVAAVTAATATFVHAARAANNGAAGCSSWLQASVVTTACGLSLRFPHKDI